MKRPVWLCVLAAAALTAAVPSAWAQGPVLVRDIATGTRPSPGGQPSPPVRFQGEDYFSADDGFLGAELWATDGTSRGTRLVADLCPGRCPGGPLALAPSGSFLYFVANNSGNARNSFWLWRSDGSAAGTFPLVDLEISSFEVYVTITFLEPFHGGVIFLARDRERPGWSLWHSDGTRSGTRRIVRLPGRFEPGSLPGNVDWPRDPDEPGRFFFAWRGKLWATDGTAAGTGPVGAPIRPCPAGGARLGRLVVYAGGEAGRDCEPWVSDGTVRGTRRLRDAVPGDSPSDPAAFVTAGGWVYFVASDGRDRRLWKSDGTPRGTAIVSAPGSRGLAEVKILGATGARVFFVADDGEHGIELWRSDGTPATTRLVADLAPGAAGSIVSRGQVLGKDLFFVHFATNVGPTALFRTQGTAGSTVRLTGPEVSPREILSVAGRRVYFTSRLPETGDQLAVSDGTAAGTRRLELDRPAPSSDPRFLIAGPGGLVFSAFDGSGDHLWRSTGDAEDTGPFEDLGRQALLNPGSGGMFYYADDDWRFGWTDGRSVLDLLPANAIIYPEPFVELGDRTLFFAWSSLPGATWQSWIWSSDGTPEGTAPVAPAGAPGLTNFQLLAAPFPGGGEARYLTYPWDTSSPAAATLSATDGTACARRFRPASPSSIHCPSPTWSSWRRSRSTSHRAASATAPAFPRRSSKRWEPPGTRRYWSCAGRLFVCTANSTGGIFFMRETGNAVKS